MTEHDTQRSATGTAIPVIDLGPLVAGASGALARVADQLGRAAREVGFFYVIGHGIADAQRADVLAASRQLFTLDPAAKDRLSIANSPHNRGYVSLHTEQLDPSGEIDRKEAFNIGLELAPDDPRVVAGEPFRGVNLWPDIDGWRTTMLAYFDAAWELARVLHRAVAIDLGLPADHFQPSLDDPLATLRLLRYPAPNDGTASLAAGGLGAGAHSDYGNLTLLLTDGTPGLQVQRRDGTWVDAPHVADAFVCNIGDCLMRWTNDVYRSTPHRVLAPTAERYSVAFFMDANPAAVVECLPTCVSDERPARYEPITAGEYLRQRLDATYAHRRD